jgi:hypothetical protein
MFDFLEGNDRGRRLEVAHPIKLQCESQRHNWVAGNGLLKRVVHIPAKKNKAGIVLQPAEILLPTVLPQNSKLKQKLFSWLHDHPTAAHIGESKLTNALRKRFYWKGWYREAQQYVQTCDGCQRYKALRSLRLGVVLPIHAPTPFHTLSID